eukprot:2149183-Prorocentrum_lima.AAC.1
MHVAFRNLGKARSFRSTYCRWTGSRPSTGYHTFASVTPLRDTGCPLRCWSRSWPCISALTT